MIIFGSSLSPFVRKVLVLAAEKGIAVENRVVAPGGNDPDFIAASPFRKIPALLDGDYALSDSSAIIHYLEAKFPEPALIPSEPRARGKTIWWDEFADTILVACGAKMFFNRIVAPRFLGKEGDLDAAEKAEREELPPLLAYLEGAVPDSGYLVGDSLTLADIAVASPFVNLTHCDVAFDSGAYPRLAAYVGAILARPTFAALIGKETAMLKATA